MLIKLLPHPTGSIFLQIGLSGRRLHWSASLRSIVPPSVFCIEGLGSCCGSLSIGAQRVCQNPGMGQPCPSVVVVPKPLLHAHAGNCPLTSHVPLKHSIPHLFHVMKRETEAAAGKWPARSTPASPSHLPGSPQSDAGKT